MALDHDYQELKLKLTEVRHGFADSSGLLPSGRDNYLCLQSRILKSRCSVDLPS
jgi:hypothetical protein